jgi:flagellar biosynthesis protein FlhG
VKSLAEQDHYEALEVRRSASLEEIERAYRMAQATYVDDSLAGYSVFEEGDVETIRERIEIAYRTLSDAAAREAYDARLERRSAVEPAPAEPEEPPEPDSDAASGAATLEPLDAFDDLDADCGDFDGPRLRRVRLRQGVELDDIASVTKVNPTYLSFIEEERFDDLPAAVYVRGFVIGYASCVGLDAKRVASSYMNRYEESRGSRKRSIFSRH